MTPFSSRWLFVAVLALVGCGEAGEPLRYATPTPKAQVRVSIPLSSVVVREVSLPTYATEEGIAVASRSGAISTTPDRLWADEPTRAVTLRLTNALADITGRKVASDPWPFQSDPDAVVEVRLEEFVAEEAGRFVAEGRYYVARQQEDIGADHAHSFRLIQPFDPERGFSAIAAARASIINALAADIARRGLR
jgi:uncharacterized lipoprotein YmbA